MFWDRVDELKDKDKVLRLIQNGEEKIQAQNQHYDLLRWKASRCYEIDFDQQFYGKCKSKFFTYENDKYLANKVMKLGIHNMSQIK